MKNKKLLTQTIGKVSTAVDAKDGNLIIEIPIIKSLFEDPIIINAIYNSNNPDTIGVFGKQTKLNYEKVFTPDGNDYISIDAYGNEERFTYTNGKYVCNQTLDELIVSTNILDDESEETLYVLKDKYNNQVTYADWPYYPQEVKSDGDVIMLGDLTGIPSYSKPNGEKVTLNTSIKTTSVKYLKDGEEETYRTNLEYDTQNRLTMVIDPLGEVHEFEYGSDYIKIKHSPTNSYLKFTFTNNKVINIERGVLRGSLTPSQILITYNTDHTKITTKEPNTLNGYHEYSSYVFFDQEGRLLYEFDEKGYGYKLEYGDFDNLSFEGNVFNLKTTKNNLIIDDGEIQAGGQDLPTPFNLLDDEQYPLNGELIYETENVKSKENTLSFFIKGTGVINIFVDNVLLDTVSATSNYELHQIRVSVDEINKPVTIKITGNGHIFGVKLQEGVVGLSYIYDFNMNLIKVKSGDKSMEYSYNTDHKVIQIKENGKIIKKFDYSKDEYSRRITVQEPYQKSNSKIITSTSIDNINRKFGSDYVTFISKERNGMMYDIYTSRWNPSADIYNQDESNKQEYQYFNNNGQTTLRETYVSQQQTSYKESFNYNSNTGKLFNHNLYMLNDDDEICINNTNYLYKNYNPYLFDKISLDVSSQNISQNIRYEYYGNDLIRSVYVNNILIESFQYYYNTALISFHQYSNGEGYYYTYDDKNRITEIMIYSPYIDEDEVINYESTGNGFRFEYDDDDLLVKVKQLKDNVESTIEEFEYENDMLKKIKDGSFTQTILHDQITSSGYFKFGNTSEKPMLISTDSLDYHKKLSVDDTPTYLNEDDETISYSSTTYYNSDIELNDKYELYPLHKSFVSQKGKEPVSYTNTTNDDIFEFDNDTHKKVFNSKNKQVTFETDYNDGLSFIFKVKALDSDESKLLKLKFNNNNVEVIKTTTGNIKFKFNNTIYSTSLTLNDTLWHNFGIRLSEYTQYDDEDTEYCYLGFDMVLDNTRYGIGIENYEIINKVLISLGENLDLNQRYEMLATGVTNSEQELKVDYESLNNITTKVETYSADGLLITEQIYDSNVLSLDKKYEYKITAKSAVVEKETSNFGTQIREYEYKYDDANRVTEFDGVEYFYDALGRLIKTDDLMEIDEYVYDSKGNITNNAGLLLEYDSLDRVVDLTSTYNGLSYSISYEDENIFLPTSYLGNTLEYEGNKLVKFENNNIKISFEYNQDGLRTKKTVLNKNHNTTETYKFYYNGDKLIRQDVEGNSSESLSFLYDSKGELFGFETYDGNRYYYVRNNLKNITHIIDSNGNRMVYYSYKPYGTFTTQVYNTEGTTNSQLIADLNPFKYKGYYYDEETQLFYCNSRYYSPELCRWISPDSIEYLDPESINGLNLYAYCGNDPINRYDPSGHAWDWVLDIVSVAWSLYDFIKDSTWENAGWLALDVVFAVVPFLTGSSIMKAASKLDDVSDIGGYMNKFDNVYDSIVIGNDMGRVTNLAFDTGSMIYDGYKQMNALNAMGRADEFTDAMRYAAKVENARFIMDKYKAGYKIINAGSDGRGFFKMMKSAYGMELKILYRLKYGNKLHKLWWILNSGRRIIW